MNIKTITTSLLAAALIFVLAGCSQNGSGVKAGPVTDQQKNAAIEFVTKLVSQQVPPGMSPQVEFDKELDSDLPGFNLLRLKVTVGQNVQTVSLYFTADGKKAIPAQAVLDLESGMPQGAARQDENYTTLEPGTLDLANQPTKGNPDAKVTITVLSDFQCPACRHHNQMFEQVIWPQYKDKAKFVFLNFPLERIHPWAMKAAIAGECAFNQSNEAFWALHDGFFENQGEVVEANVVDKALKYMAGTGIDEAKFRSCVENQETMDKVRADMEQGKAIGLRGTPTYIVNNKVLQSGLTPEAIDKAIQETE